MAEWSIAPVLKTGNGQPFVSSNLTASARQLQQQVVFQKWPCRYPANHQAGVVPVLFGGPFLTHREPACDPHVAPLADRWQTSPMVGGRQWATQPDSTALMTGIMEQPPPAPDPLLDENPLVFTEREHFSWQRATSLRP